MLFFGRRRRRVHVAHGSFYRGKDHVQAGVDQIDAGERDHEIAADDNALGEHVIENVDQRELVLTALACKDNRSGVRTHLEPALSAFADTNE